jgi:AhpD family alkylhydroperoxidase
MARVSPPASWGNSPESTPTLAPGVGTISPSVAAVPAVLSHRPEFARAIDKAFEAIFVHPTLPPRLIELIRLRIAFHNQCRTCMAMRHQAARDDGVTEGLVCSLEKPEEASDLTAGERAALRYADLFATDHLAIDDAVYDDLRRYFDEGEIVEIGINCAMHVGMGRLVATWNLIDDLPEQYRDPERRYGPWDVAHTIPVGNAVREREGR